MPTLKGAELLAAALKSKVGAEVIADAFEGLAHSALGQEASRVLAKPTVERVVTNIVKEVPALERTGLLPKVSLEPEKDAELEMLTALSSERFLPTREAAEKARLVPSFLRYKGYNGDNDPGVMLRYKQPVSFDFPNATGRGAQHVIQHDSGLITLINPNGIKIEPRPCPTIFIGRLANKDIPEGLLDRHPILSYTEEMYGRTSTTVPDWLLGKRLWAFEQARLKVPNEITLDQSGEIQRIKWHDTGGFSPRIPIESGPFRGLTGNEIIIDAQGATLVQNYSTGKAECRWNNGDDYLTTVRTRWGRGKRVTHTRTEPISWLGEEPEELPTFVSLEEFHFD